MIIGVCGLCGDHGKFNAYACEGGYKVINGTYLGDHCSVFISGPSKESTLPIERIKSKLCSHFQLCSHGRQLKPLAAACLG